MNETHGTHTMAIEVNIGRSLRAMGVLGSRRIWFTILQLVERTCLGDIYPRVVINDCRHTIMNIDFPSRR